MEEYGFLSAVCGDPNWRAVFNTTHRRDEGRQRADQRGCRGPIKLLEFTSCHHTIPRYRGHLAPPSIKPRCRTRRIWLKNHHNNNISKNLHCAVTGRQITTTLATKAISILKALTHLQTDLITRQLTFYWTCLVVLGHLQSFAVKLFWLFFGRTKVQDKYNLLLRKATDTKKIMTSLRRNWSWEKKATVSQMFLFWKNKNYFTFQLFQRNPDLYEQQQEPNKLWQDHKTKFKPLIYR